MATLIHTAAEAVSPSHTAQMPIPGRVLMVRPTHFNLDTPINAHMLAKDGSKHLLNLPRAIAQWEALVNIYRQLGIDVRILEGAENLPDNVFSANHALPFVTPSGERHAIMSKMANSTRHLEVPLTRSYLEGEGYVTTELRAASKFEGMGDALWLPGKRLLLGGHGFRTSPEAYAEVSDATGAPVALFELSKPKFYHLDTCLSMLTEHSAIACRDAYSADGWNLLKALFPRLIEVPLDEADAPGFACNAHCPDGKHVIIQSGCKSTNAELRRAGFEVIETDTSEFIKSGGSVFCMKLMYF